MCASHVFICVQGDGAWEPKAGAVLALNKRVKAHLARSTSGPTAAAAPSHSRAAARLPTAGGTSGASSQRLAAPGNNDRGEWLCSGSVSPSGASEDAAAVDEEGEMMEEEREEGGPAAVEDDPDAVMCEAWPNQDAELDGQMAGHGYSTSQEVRRPAIACTRDIAVKHRRTLGVKLVVCM